MLRRIALILSVILVSVAGLGGEPLQGGRRHPVTNPQFAAEGVIASVVPGAFRIQTSRGSIDLSISSTTVVTRGGLVVSADSLQPGDYTMTEARMDGKDSAVAIIVRLYTVPPSATTGGTVRIGGVVASVSPAKSELQLETRGGVILTVGVNDTTVIRRDGVAIRLTEIAAGSFANVLAKPLGDRSLLALEIDVAPPPSTPRPAIFGEVTEVRVAELTLVVRVHGGTVPTLAPDALAVVRANAATMIFRDGVAIAFDAIHTGNFVFASGDITSNGSLLAARIDVSEKPAMPTRIAGRVLEVSVATRALVVAPEIGWMSDSAPVRPVTVVANDATRIERDGAQVPFDSIKAGDFVKAAGEWQGDSTLLASVIFVATPPPPPSPSILGTIESIDSAARTIAVRVAAVRPMEIVDKGLVTVRIDASTQIVRNGEASTFDQLAVGDAVRVTGDLRDDGSILAHRIDVMLVPPHPDNVIGEVVAVSDRGVEIIAVTPYPTFAPVHVLVLVAPDTQINRNGAPATLGAIQVGDYLWAAGTWKDDNTLLARRIEAKSKPVLAAFVSGTVKAIAGRDLTVAPDMPMMQPGDTRPMPATPVTVRATDQTVVYRGDAQIRFAEIRIDDVIAAEGEWLAENVLGARIIRVLPSVKTVRGTIGAVDVVEPSFMLIVDDTARVRVRVRAATLITKNGFPAGFDALEIGKHALVTGPVSADGSIAAISVAVMDDPPVPPLLIYLKGVIEALAPNGFTLRTPDSQIWAVRVTSLTLITKGGLPVGVDALRAGDLAELAGMPVDRATVTALKIAVMTR